MCKDGSIQDLQDPECPIGWKLGDRWYRLTQVGFEPKKCEVITRGTIYPVPDGKGFIGSQVFTAERVDEVRSRYSREMAFDAASQNAQMTENDEDEEGEVTSLPDLKP